MEVLTAIQTSALSTWLQESTSPWAYPFVLTLHTVGLALLVGINTAFDLRVLGFGRGIPLDGIERLFSVMWIGFWLNAATGAMLYTTVATTKGTTPLFIAKLGMVAIGVVLIVVLRRAVYGRGQAVPLVTRAAQVWAALSLAVWTMAILTGRLMAYVDYR